MKKKRVCQNSDKPIISFAQNIFYFLRQCIVCHADRSEASLLLLTKRVDSSLRSE